MKGRPFRFGVLIHNWGTGQEWFAKARHIEDLGYNTFLIPDHLNKQFGPIPALAAAAAVTTTLRIGTIVLANDFRHPVILARDAATLDLLSDGRLEFGLGAGWRPSDFEQTGIPFDRAPERFERLEEALQVIKGIFTEEPFSFAGRYYTVTELVGLPKPVQQPRPPILVGGGGKRILSLAAREADIVSLAARARPKDDAQDWESITDAATTDQIDWIRQAAGDRFNRLEINVMIYGLNVTDDGEAAVRQSAGRFGLPEEEVRASPHVLIGSVDTISEDLRRSRERYGISYVIVPEIFAPAFAPVVARLSGK
jgi:probable F420-dependent oxidoreductase